MAEAPTITPKPVVEKSSAQPAYLIVSESIRTKCGVPETPFNSPQFDFDAAALRPRGEGILDLIATCMRDGSLKGQGVTIIGHADPRGTDISTTRSLGWDEPMRRRTT
jgi:peptidoglycan-associated lipoprotein